MLQQWPVRVPRPISERLRITEPLITGQRIIDTFFPIGKGGAAAIPGGFGTGKTITQHQLAKWSDAEIIVFIGCGERGNEMTEVLREFPELKDPRSGRPLMERTILIANTSNMPVAAREVSIYTGITLAEYYRDMGLSVAVFADSTSRWAEALRELAARLEEMPAEEGFPASLPTRLAQFYERGGAVTTLAGERASVSIVGAVSPPGGDFSEPVTQHTRRFIRCFWALDTELANARHYPSIHWLHSYSEYAEDVSVWWKKLAPDWIELRTEALTLLQREDRLQQIVKLVGPDVLPDGQRLILFIAEIMKDGFITQSAFDENDMYCTPERQIALLRIILMLYRKARDLIQEGVPLARIRGLACVPQVLRAKAAFGNAEMEKARRAGTEGHGRDRSTGKRTYAKRLPEMNATFDVEDQGLQYVGASRIEGPLVVVERIRDVGYDEIVEILDASRSRPHRPRARHLRDTGGGAGPRRDNRPLQPDLARPLPGRELSPSRLKADVGTRLRRSGPAGRRRAGRALRGSVRRKRHADQPLRAALSP